MMRHDEALLWEYAARELPSEDARLVQHHLTECPECQEKLTDVRTARGALEAVKGTAMSFTYTKADAAIASAVEKRMTKAVFGRRWVLAFSGSMVAAGLALVAYGVATRLPSAEPAPVAVVSPVEVKKVPAVEKAAGLTLIGAQTKALGDGEKLASGDVLRTDWKGEGTLKLPEGTRLRLGSSSQLALARAEADDVTLALDHGRVAIAASKARRKGFVVHTNGLMVTVVGTQFSVQSSRDGVEIAVAEGKVSLEPPTGLPMFVTAGQRVRFDARWRSTRSTITAAQKRELAALADEPKPATVRPAVVPASGGVAPVAAPPTSASREEMTSLVGASIDELAPLPAPAPAAAPVQVAAVAPAPPAAPVASKPDMSGLEVPLLVSPLEDVKPQGFIEWPTLPKQAPAGAAAAAGTKLSDKDEPAIDHEGIFIIRAERALNNGGCEKHLLGLEEIATDPSRGPRAEKARVLRARCFDARGKAKEAENEYRKYVNEYPTGTFLDEARSVLSGR
ncbi:MAG: FecR domain-containing protein [Myxococcaceae bacterium]|nr:FecR domain-containing protein [Myxococcaceae bacterium]